MPQITEEDLKNMSPEQIAQLQRENCIFCHIVKGKVSSRKIYEDEKIIAILDINPANPGHILLMPKEHYAIMPLVPDDIIKHIFVAAKKISHILLKTFRAEGTNMLVANGIPAGQKAQHFMVHIIPRKEGDSIGCFDIRKFEAKEEELDRLMKEIKPHIGKFLGVGKEVINMDKKEKEETETIAGSKKAAEGRTSGSKDNAGGNIDLDTVTTFFKKDHYK